jgi:hypothetical protein
MATFIKKENLTISVGEYTDKSTGKPKKQWRTIGELITMQGDDGQPYQFFKLWGAGGVTEGKVFASEGQQVQQQIQQPPQYQQPPQGQPMGVHQGYANLNEPPF